MRKLAVLSITVPLVLFGCGESDEVQSVDSGIGSHSPVEDAGADAHDEYVEAELGVCYGENTDCDTPPRTIVLEPGPETGCIIEEVNDVEADWKVEMGEIPCPLPPCRIFDPVIAVGSDGSVSVVADVVTPVSDGEELRGAWFALYSAEGEKISEELINYVIPERGSQWSYPEPSLAIDSHGSTFMVDTPVSLARTGTFSISEYTATGELLGVPITRREISDAFMRLSPTDELVLAVEYPTAANEGEEPGTRLDIAKYDKDGRLIWNQSQLGNTVLITRIDNISFDSDGGISALFSQQSGRRDPIEIGIANLDRDGNILWTGQMVDREGRDRWRTRFTVASDGSIFVGYQDTFEVEQGGFWEDKARIEKYGPDGAPLWSWTAPHIVWLDSVSSLGTDAENNVYLGAVLSNTEFMDFDGVGGSMSEEQRNAYNEEMKGFRIYSLTPDGKSCSSFFVRVPPCVSDDGGEISIPEAWCSDVSIYVQPNREIYFSMDHVFGRITGTR